MINRLGFSGSAKGTIEIKTKDDSASIGFDNKIERVSIGAPENNNGKYCEPGDIITKKSSDNSSDLFIVLEKIPVSGDAFTLNLNSLQDKTKTPCKTITTSDLSGYTRRTTLNVNA